jgi:putative tricarboxylic transport membrane protein
MKKSCCILLSVLVGLWVLDMRSASFGADKFPSKPITLIVPIDAGGGLDLTIRPLCDKLGAILGQPVVVVNKPGGGSSIGYRATHDAKPDGYTIGAANSAIVTNKMQGLLPYDYHEFTVLAAIGTGIPVVVASTRSKRTFKTFKEVVEFAKSHPDEISIAAGGKGQPWWTAAKDIETVMGIRFNFIPQVGSGASSMAQVAGGHVELGIVTLGEGKPQIDAGNAIPLAVALPGNTRIPIYPNVPCVNELGYGNMRYYSIASVIGPPNMPKQVTDTLVKALETASRNPEYKTFVEDKLNAGRVFFWPPEQTVKELDKQKELMRDIFEKAGILKEK